MGIDDLSCVSFPQKLSYESGSKWGTQNCIRAATNGYVQMCQRPPQPVCNQSSAWALGLGVGFRVYRFSTVFEFVWSSGLGSSILAQYSLMDFSSQHGTEAQRDVNI